MKVDRIAGIAVALLLVAGLAAGFSMTGSPDHMRAVAQDRQRQLDIGLLAQHARRHEILPSLLPPGAVKRLDGSDATRDPASGIPYHYARIDPQHFRIYATFALPSDSPDYNETVYQTRIPHPAGHVCFRMSRSEAVTPEVETTRA